MSLLFGKPAFHTRATEDEQGAYTVKEVAIASEATDWRPFPENFFHCFDDVMPINYTKGHLSIDGFINKNKGTMGVETVVDGHRMGPFFGSIMDGWSVTYDFKNTSVHKLRFMIKNGCELHIDVDGNQTKIVSI